MKSVAQQPHRSTSLTRDKSLQLLPVRKRVIWLRGKTFAMTDGTRQQRRDVAKCVTAFGGNWVRNTKSARVTHMVTLSSTQNPSTSPAIEHQRGVSIVRDSFLRSLQECTASQDVCLPALPLRPVVPGHTHHVPVRNGKRTHSFVCHRCMRRRDRHSCQCHRRTGHPMFMSSMATETNTENPRNLPTLDMFFRPRI